MGGKPSTSTSADMRLKYNQASRERAAKDGTALPDGSFPIRNKQELAKAILAIGRASDPRVAKQWIIKRARQLDAVELLPKSWNVKS